MPLSWRIGRRGACTAAASACATTGLALLTLAFLPHQQPPPAPPSTAARAPDHAPADRPKAQAQVLPRSEPVRVSAPKIDLTTKVKPVGIAEDGSIALPEDADHAGWYTGSVTPGERGNAILVGHVDSADGPAAFYGLGALREGGRIAIERRDGRDAVFTITRMDVHPRNDFPSDRVYRPTAVPQLTLITCTGWDEDKQDYRANLVITAQPTTG